jgi:hypothetical protein
MSANDWLVQNRESKSRRFSRFFFTFRDAETFWIAP